MGDVLKLPVIATDTEDRKFSLGQTRKFDLSIMTEGEKSKAPQQ